MLNAYYITYLLYEMSFKTSINYNDRTYYYIITNGILIILFEIHY